MAKKKLKYSKGRTLYTTKKAALKISKGLKGAGIPNKLVKINAYRIDKA